MQLTIKQINEQIRGHVNRGTISDGYHTFDDLYQQRMVLFSTICSLKPDLAWKSWKHEDGTMFQDYFICGITTPEGEYTYHYHKVHWDEFQVRELPHSPRHDGHTSDDVRRLYSLLED